MKVLKTLLRAVGVFTLLLLSSCYHTSEKIDPQIDYAVQDKYLLSLPSAFQPLSTDEKMEEWSREYRVGVGFAHELDLYQAITAFKRAQFLLPPERIERKTEISYGIFLCYYLGRKYAEAVYTFENSELKYFHQEFPSNQDLLLLIYDCYSKTGNDTQAEKILWYIHENFPDAAAKLYVYTQMLNANMEKLDEISKNPSYEYIGAFVSDYEKDKKSIARAKHLNAICPGAGYFYLGQTQSAITALMLNGLFIAASAYFFDHGNIAAGAIFTSFELGWYFGGIYGAAEETKFFNERLYEKKATKVMNEKGLFPGFMIKYAF